MKDLSSSSSSTKSYLERELGCRSRSKMSTEPVETFVFLPYSKYEALDNRAKKVKSDESSLPVLDESQPNEDAAGVSINTSATSEPGEEAKTQLGKDVTKS